MRIFTFILVLFALLITSCQVPEIPIDEPNDIIAVSSSCTGNNSIKAIYQIDAERIALRKILANPANTWNDSIYIDPVLVEEVQGALLGVHNGFQMIYRDSVVGIYGIHTFSDPVLDRMLVKVDESYSWVEQWKLGNQFTGNYDIDELMNKYDLSFVEYYKWSIGNYALIQSDNSLNIKALTRKFEIIPGVLNAQIDAEAGDDDNITYTRNESEGYRELIYSVGFGDCTTDCTKRRYWKFWIKDIDCNLEFKQAWGDPAP